MRVIKVESYKNKREYINDMVSDDDENQHKHYMQNII
jgi:hypothetical protein